MCYIDVLGSCGIGKNTTFIKNLFYTSFFSTYIHQEITKFWTKTKIVLRTTDCRPPSYELPPKCILKNLNRSLTPPKHHKTYKLF